MAKATDLKIGDKFYDREYGYVEITNVFRDDTTVLVDLAYLVGPLIRTSQPLRNAGSLFIGIEDDIDTVDYCTRCGNLRSFADLEDNAGICSICITNHDRWADENFS